MQLISYALSDVGLRRAGNEDSFLCKPELGLYVVADGMGGHQAGEHASRLAVEKLGQALVAPSSSDPTDREALTERLRRATQEAGAAIYDAARSDRALDGMGTTLTSLWFWGGRAYLGHVGDSRAYQIRTGRVVQLSEDHSWVAEQVRAGVMTEEEANESPYRHVITRSVGFDRIVQVDCSATTVEPGDCYLLCSDGLSNYLEGDELGRFFTSNFYRDIPRLLVELANDRGGEDNITVVLVHVVNDLDPAAQGFRQGG